MKQYREYHITAMVRPSFKYEEKPFSLKIGGWFCQTEAKKMAVHMIVEQGFLVSELTAHEIRQVD